MIKNFIRSSARGFTLIELLVVIAIIGILAGIVLASLNSAREGAGDAKVKEQLSSFRTAAEIYYGQNGNTYGANSTAGNHVCSPDSGDTTGVYSLLQGSSYTDGTAPGCTDDAGAASAATQYSAYHELSTGNFFCVDSTGQSVEVASGSWSAPTGGNPCP